MTATLFLDKSKVVAALRLRQLHDRAQWVDKSLPELIDAGKNHALMHMLGIDLVATAHQEEK